jgi:hypothetical protein
MPCVLLSVPLCGFSDACSPPDRFGRVGVLHVLAQHLLPYYHQHREDETLYHRRELRHVELALVPPRQERGLKRVRPAPPVLPLRLEDRREKILYVVGRLNVSRAKRSTSPAFKNLCGSPGSKTIVSPGPANLGALRAAGSRSAPLLDCKGPPGSCGRASGSAAGLDEVLELEAVAGGILGPPDEGEPLPGPVLDGVRVGVSTHDPSLRGSGGDSGPPDVHGVSGPVGEARAASTVRRTGRWATFCSPCRGA